MSISDPFVIAKQHDLFIWKKKYLDLGIEDEKEMLEHVKRQVEENKAELIKLKERQRSRDLEMQQILEQNEYNQRQKEAERHEHWESQEDNFVLRQQRQRSKIRIRDQRAKPIDFLSYYIEVFGVKIHDTTEKFSVLGDEIDLSNDPVELINPCNWFNGLRLQEMEEFVTDIESYKAADCPENKLYWNDLSDIAKNELSKLQAFNNKGKPETSLDGISSSVIDEVTAQFENNSIEELDELEQSLLASNDIDYAFTQSTLSILRSQRARLRLTKNHEKNLKIHGEKLAELQSKSAEKLLEKHSALHRQDHDGDDNLEDDSDFISLAKRDMDETVESRFDVEEPIRNNYTHDNRKPRYFNRVHTGFEWNKYNKTHYDIDNPPPKVVQGYKFNIFYPDLIDKSATPTFSLTPCAEDKNFSIIRFSAGRPYADIAFRIVNREWNNSHRSGYKCQFRSNILQLHFFFKRDRYRR